MGGEREGARGQRLAEGKTKVVYADPADPALAVIVHKDDITAGDGARRDRLPGKARSVDEPRAMSSGFCAHPASRPISSTPPRRRDGRPPLRDDSARGGDATHRHRLLSEAQRGAGRDAIRPDRGRALLQG